MAERFIYSALPSVVQGECILTDITDTVFFTSIVRTHSALHNRSYYRIQAVFSHFYSNKHKDVLLAFSFL